MNIAVEQLDRRFRRLKSFARMAHRPSKGWIRAIREALGMTTQQFARRLGVQQPRVIVIERSELEGKLTMESLERAAHALECDLVYALIPRRSLGRILDARATELADELLQSVDQTMKLEDQQVKSESLQKQSRRRIKEKLVRQPSRLWRAT
jgi:predicted DNA-binding mobile mystery protein A